MENRNNNIPNHCKNKTNTTIQEANQMGNKIDKEADKKEEIIRDHLIMIDKVGILEVMGKEAIIAGNIKETTAENIKETIKHRIASRGTTIKTIRTIRVIDNTFDN